LVARNFLREARREVLAVPRAALLRAQIAERQSHRELALRLLRLALDEAPVLLQEELPHLLALAEKSGAMQSSRRWRRPRNRGIGELKNLVFAAVGANLASVAQLHSVIETVFAKDATLGHVARCRR